MKKIIMGIQVEQRSETATEVQRLLTEYGCIIKTRLGLHQASENGNICSENGLIIVEFIMNAENKIKEMEEKLSSVEGIKIRKMEF